MYDEDSDRGTHWTRRAVRDYSLRPGRSPPGSAWCANNVLVKGPQLTQTVVSLVSGVRLSVIVKFRVS